MLNLYLPGINTYIFPKRNYVNIFSGKLFYELDDWVENHPHVIHSPNVSDSLFVKINGTLIKKQKRLLQMSVREMHNDMILPIYQGGFLVQELFMEKYVLEIRHLGSTCQNV